MKGYVDVLMLVVGTGRCGAKACVKWVPDESVPSGSLVVH